MSDKIIAGAQFFYCRPVTRELHVFDCVRYTKSATELVVIHKSFPYSRKELVSHANLANLTKRLRRPKGPKAISQMARRFARACRLCRVYTSRMVHTSDSDVCFVRLARFAWDKFSTTCLFELLGMTNWIGLIKLLQACNARISCVQFVKYTIGATNALLVPIFPYFQV